MHGSEIMNSGLQAQLLVCATEDLGKGTGIVQRNHFLWVTDVGDRYVRFGGQVLGLNVLRRNCEMTLCRASVMEKIKLYVPYHLQPTPDITVTVVPNF